MIFFNLFYCLKKSIIGLQFKNMNTREDIPELELQDKDAERFCQHYAGQYFGSPEKAYIATYGENPLARREGEKLLLERNVFDRILHLRKVRLLSLAIDQTRIMELRLKIVYDQDEPSAVKLAAMRDIEKSIAVPEKTPEKKEPKTRRLFARRDPLELETEDLTAIVTHVTNEGN